MLAGLLALAPAARAQQCTVELLDTRYEVYRLPTLGGVTLRAAGLSNAIEYGDPGDSIRTASAVGTQSNHAAAYSVENGTSYLSPTRNTDVSSYARGISPNGGVVVGSITRANSNGWERAFRFRSGSGFQLLGDIYPAVAELEAMENGERGPTAAWRITDDGTMLISGRGGYYLLTDGGELTPVSQSVCAGIDLNSGAQLPPAGTLVAREDESTFCALSNHSHNDSGGIVGELWNGDPASPVRPHRNGSELAGAPGAAATSVSNTGWIGGSRGFVWNDNNDLVDLKEVLVESCGEPTSVRSGVDATYVNDQNWLQWASWMFRPQCPQISFSSSGTGFEFHQGSPAVRVGNRFTTTLTIRNDGPVPLENFTVQTTPSFSHLFRRLSGPILSGTLAPGESMSSTVELEAIAAGTWTGANVVTGTSNCGAVTFTSPTSRIVSLGDVIALRVNSSNDRPRAAGTNACDTGFDVDNGDPECTLRAALEEVLAGRGSNITFDVPNVPIPTIVLSSALPRMTVPVQIDGTTQSGGRVEVRGAPGMVGLHLSGGDSIVKGLVLNGFANAGNNDGRAILLDGAGGNTIIGNYIGTDASGTVAIANQIGVHIDGSANNTIGGADADANIIAGNDTGVLIVKEGANGNRILGNLLGLGATGSFVRNRGAVVIGHGNGTVIGGAEPNYIASLEIDVLIAAGAGSTVNNTEISNNFLGLDVAGTHAGSPSATYGAITAHAGPGSSMTGMRILDNHIAGQRHGVWLAGEGLTGAQVIGNRIGLAFNGSGTLPSGLTDPASTMGVRVEDVPSALIENNLIAGTAYGILAAGSIQFIESAPNEHGETTYTLYGPLLPLNSEPGAGNDVRIVGNTVGLNEHQAVPPGADQRYGISVFGGAQFISIENNTVAGYSGADVWLLESSDLSVIGNRIGSANGADHGSTIGVRIDHVNGATIGGEGLVGRNIIARQSEVAISVEGDSSDIAILNNYIGTDILGASAWSNGAGIRVRSTEDGIANLLIRDNIVGGSAGAAMEIANTADTQISSNRIGVSPNGIAVANGVGVVLLGTPASVNNNVIAHNGGPALAISGAAEVLISRNSIYENTDGILYETPPFDPPTGVLSMRTDPNDQNQVGMFVAIPPTGATGEVTIELFGNRHCDDAQGRVLLLQRKMPANEPLIEFFSADALSAFGTTEGLTATVTRDGSTSRFSACGSVQPFTDTDDDGAMDLFEALGGDRNKDGIDDIEQRNVATHLFVPSEGDAQYITLVSAPGTTIQQSTIASANLPPLAAGMTYTFGLIAFDIQGVTEGAQTVVDVLLESGAPAANQEYIKLRSLSSPEVRTMPNSGTGDRAEPTADGWRLYLTDGGEWDSDATANGRVRDPGGPVRVTPSNGGTPPPAATPKRRGGGSLDVTLLLLLSIVLLAHRQRRQAIRV